MESLSRVIQSTSAPDPLLFRQVEVLLDIGNKKVLSEIKGLTEAIIQLGTEIELIKLKLQERPRAEQGAQSSQPVGEAKAAQSKLSLTPETAAQIKAAGQDPNQQLTPGNVSIEKYFYFGNKRR
ncbi:hypothetical protein HYV84_03625 [Candidatus Woesearchaeota archaeon]|nr:hypothetical protein [Candidatus Woesearchaeota archaeon]